MKHMPALLFALLLALPALALGDTFTCIVPDGQYVNVRKQASATAATWGVLHNGDTIDADPADIASGFFKTTFDGHEAYVSVKYFEIAEDTNHTVSANGRVRVRKTPGGQTRSFIQPGESVYVSAWRYAGDGTKWARCLGGAYVSADCLTAP